MSSPGGWTFSKASPAAKPTQKKIAGLKGWRPAIKNRVEQIDGQEDFNKRILNAGERLVVIYNYCAADRELLPYMSALSKEHPKVLFLKNNMDVSYLKDLTNAPWVYFYSVQQQVEECPGNPTEKGNIKSSIVKFSKPSTVVLLRKLRRLKQIQQTTKFDSLEASELIDAFKKHQISGKKLDYPQFRETLLYILKSKGLAAQSTGLKVIKDSLHDISSSLLNLVSAKYENASGIEGEEREKAESEARVLEEIFQKLVTTEYKVDLEVCRHLNCGADDTKENSLSLDALEQIFSHLFKLFANYGENGEVDVEEFVAGLSIFCKGTIQEKLQRVFSFIDNNHDHYLTEAELAKYLRAIHTIVLAIEPSCQRGNKLIARLAKQMFQEMDTNHDNKVSYQQFESFALNSSFNHLFAWMNVFQPPKPEGQVDDEEDTLSAAGKLFVELIETFVPHSAAASALPRERSQSTTRPIHTGTQCDGCNQNPIIGTRYYCMDCEERDEHGVYTGGFDLCETCFKKAKEQQKQGQATLHSADHEFVELTEPETGPAVEECKVM